jgi:regulator of protease activity HflC (stomatin/prohibitin superfamily)
MDLFSLLGEVIRSLLKVVPRLVLVRSTHAGVKFRYGTKVLRIDSTNGMFKTGLHVVWPLVTEHEILPVVRQAIELPAQYLTTKDGATVAVSGTLVFEVPDIVKAMTETSDFEDDIAVIAAAHIKKTLMKFTFEEIKVNSVDVDKSLTREMRSALRFAGVRVLEVCLSDFSKTRVLSLFGAGSNIV